MFHRLATLLSIVVLRVASAALRFRDGSIRRTLPIMIAILAVVALTPHRGVLSADNAGRDVSTEVSSGPDVAAAQKDSALSIEPSVRPANGVRLQDSVWMISTRSMSCSNKNAGDPEVFRLDGLVWVNVERNELIDSLTSGEIVIYVHGNRMEFYNAAERGRRYYEQLAASEPPPIRFIIWSWPSDQIKRAFNDVRAKAARADCEAEFLAEFLQSVPTESTILMIGFSFGASVISGALQHAAETQMACPQARVVFVAPALATGWLGPNQHHWLAWEKMESLLIFYNSCDRALKRFRFSDPCFQPEALGYTGPWWASQVPSRVEHEDTCSLIGKAHTEANYLASTYLMNRVRGFLDLSRDFTQELGQEPPTELTYRD